MNKKIIILIAVLILLVVLVIIYFAVAYQPVDEGQISIKTDQGTVVLDDIYQKAEEMLPAGNLGLRKTDDYIIDYYPELRTFSIALLNPEIEVARLKAEQDFLATLNISEEEACKLEVTVGVPNSVNPKYAGIIYPLSFCQ